MKQAQLPDRNVKRDQIKNMRVGQTAYGTAWALVVDENRNAWLNPRHAVQRHPGGTMKMEVYRGEDGFYVRLVSQYEPREQDTTGYLPVAGWIGKDI